MTVDPKERSTWRSGVRSAMQLASYLERGPGMMPLHLHVNQKSNYDDDDEARLRECLNSSASLVMSTNVLEALPGKLDIKRHSPSILYTLNLTLPLPYLTLPYHILSYLIFPYLTLPYLTSKVLGDGATDGQRPTH